METRTSRSLISASLGICGLLAFAFQIATLRAAEVALPLPAVPGKAQKSNKSLPAKQDLPAIPSNTAASARNSLGALPALSSAELGQIIAQHEELGSKRFLVGIARDGSAFRTLRLEPKDWIRAADGTWQAGFNISSGGARGLRSRISIAGTFPQLDVDFHGQTLAPGQRIHWDRDTMVNAAGVWSPVTLGETQFVALRVPGSAPTSLTVTVHAVSHWFTDLKESSAPIGTSASCQEDVACVPNPSVAYLNAVRSTTRLAYVENGQSYVCTGTLLSDGDQSSEAPYILTAAHCIDSAAAAATVVSFWNFEARSCGAKSAGDYVQVTGGARLLHTNATSDVSLLMLNQLSPAGAYFAGWDPNAPQSGESGITLHHPRGDLKKVSVAQLVAGSGGNSTANFSTVAWLSGTTEPGSSGAGLFTLAGGEYRLRGTLLGGTATCGTSGQPQHAANRDLYSRLDTDYPRLKALMLSGPKPLSDYSDVWTSPEETGWLLNIRQTTEQTLLLVWNTYDDEGKPVWYVSFGGSWSSVRRYSGPLYRGTGSAYRQTWKSTQFGLQQIGEMGVEFLADGSGRLVATVQGTQIDRTIARAGF
ncbi:MAG: trypsin-like peptidase domain-containing protein [Burkholderiales bacterium]|nr:trypsin-like peptidase domain-containing protein [Burkholderiales bacterium]